MKKARTGIALLFCQCASALPPTPGQDGERAYLPCTQDGYYKQFLIRNWHSITHKDTTETFSFSLYANFSGYSSPCHGVRSGDANSGSTACEVRDDKFAVYFDFASNDFIYINHTFVCDRGEDETYPQNRFANVVATGDGRLDIGLVDTPEGHYTGTEGDNLTIAAYTKIAHRLPNADCAAASQRAEWEVRDFTFGTRVQAGNPWIIGTTVATINYDLYNKANDYLINCQAVNSSVGSFPDNPALIDPNERWPCPISYRDDLIPPEAYPTTEFKFDRSSNTITVEQEWKCEDNGHEVTFSAVGSTVLPLECHNTPTSDDNPIPKAVDCDPITVTVKAGVDS
ncbi:hypothetical protein F5Y13DRAFT_198333 [Hypoxylon sp. FL1857]|nr:hypothetical protein F5Y13DRAFT_198333 [Hypoxylon sp. FL1857]